MASKPIPKIENRSVPAVNHPGASTCESFEKGGKPEATMPRKKVLQIALSPIYLGD
jgi:hypothetical protein